MEWEIKRSGEMQNEKCEGQMGRGREEKRGMYTIVEINEVMGKANKVTR